MNKQLKELIEGDIQLEDLDEMFHIFTDPLSDLKKLEGKKSLGKKDNKKERDQQWKQRFSRR